MAAIDEIVESSLAVDGAGGDDAVPHEPGPDRPRPTRRRRRRRRTRILVAATAVALLVPVPWRLQVAGDPPAAAWRLDGRLTIGAHTVDPPGRWSWLTAGRPPLVGEVLVDLLDGTADRSVDVRGGPATSRSAVVVPLAVATGLRAAGLDVDLGVRVEVAGPREPGLPDRAVVTELNGTPLVDRRAWSQASLRPARTTTFRLSDGSRWRHDGPTLPWADIEVVDVVPDRLVARLFGNLPDLAPIRWAQEQLALGPSHGLMVALMTWAEAAGVDLSGHHVAGTGGIRGDGRVTPIGDLAAKATAARDAGADLLVFPIVQAGDLADVDPGDMAMVGVASLDEAATAVCQLAAGRGPTVLADGGAARDPALSPRAADCARRR